MVRDSQGSTKAIVGETLVGFIECRMSAGLSSSLWRLDLGLRREQTSVMHHLQKPLAFCLLAAIPTLLTAAEPNRVTFAAGDHDRSQSIVSFKLPPGNYHWPELKDAATGKSFPLQMDPAGQATAVIDLLAKGTTRTFEVVAKTVEGSRAEVAVRAKKEGGQYWFSAREKPVLYYQMEPSEVPSPDIPEHYRHGAHLMAYSPAGRLVTGDYPPDHYHHRGIFFGWTHTEFEGRTPDFWNMGKDKSGKLTGEVRFDALVSKWSGPVHGGFVGIHRWFDHTSGEAKPVLNEAWKVTVHDSVKSPLGKSHSFHVFDFETTQTCATDAPLKLPKYYYGGLGYRGNRQWDDVKNFFVLTSEGETDRAKSNQNPCRWIALSGKVDGELCGLAILGHPGNFRAPQTVRVNPKNPQTCHSVSETGEWEIVPGKPYVSRYRFVTFDGAPDQAELERLWIDYAHPVKVTVN